MASGMASLTPATSREHIADVQSLSLTEKLAHTTRWGGYLTNLEHQAISEALRILSSASDALEIGCQGGRWVEMLVGKGWRVTCTDVEEPVLRACQARVPSAKCIVVEPEDRTIPCGADSADLLLCVEVVPRHRQRLVSRRSPTRAPGWGMLMGVMMNRRSLRSLFVLLRRKLGLAPPYRDASALYSVSFSPWKRQLQPLGFQFEFEHGCCWFPFSRQSNSPLISLCAAVERALGLQRFVGISPWVVFVARKAKPD